MMMQFQAGWRKETEWNFFASNHGKGPCDGKRGVDKMRMKASALAGREIRDLDGYANIIRQVGNTVLVLVITGADSNDGHDCTKFWKGIRKYHQFRFLPEENESSCAGK